MKIELTVEQRHILDMGNGGPVEVVDPITQRAYVLLAQEQYDRIRDLIPEESVPVCQSIPLPEIPLGIRKSQEALRRDLPQLLSMKRLNGQWIGYHGDERIGIARDEKSLLLECIRRGLPTNSYYIGMIDPNEMIEVEEIEEPNPDHFESHEKYLEWINSTGVPGSLKG